MLEKERLVSYLHRDEDKDLGRYILDKIELSLKRKGSESSYFLNPYEKEIAINIIKQIDDVNFLTDGGYKGAERERITIFPDYFFPDHVEPSVKILKIKGNFKFQNLDHRDFLGSIMGLGIKRKMIGDILILDDFAQVVVADEIKEFMILNMNKVHQVSVNLSEISSDEVVIPSDNIKEIKITVASMRLDAIASAGFGESRSKITREIKNEKVKLNWKSELNPAQKVKINDLISIRGRGRIQLVNKNGLSHRGRIKLSLKRFI